MSRTRQSNPKNYVLCQVPFSALQPASDTPSRAAFRSNPELKRSSVCSSLSRHHLLISLVSPLRQLAQLGHD